MKLRHLNVHRMPGFTLQGFNLRELSAGINVIWGPNGSGKTTACIAIRHLLWPNHCADPSRIDLSSIWTSDGKDLEISLEGSTHRADTGLPLAEVQKIQPYLYTIAIDDLFQATDEEFAAAIAREIRGGYDVLALQAALAVPPRLGENEYKALLKQDDELAAVVRSQQAVYEKEKMLAALEEKIVEAQAAGKKLSLVKASLAIKERQEEYDGLIKKIASFPAGIQHVRTEDRKRLEEFQTRRRELQKALALLPERSGALAEPDLCQGLLQEIRLLDAKIESLEQARVEAEQQRLFYCGNLGLPPEKLEALDLGGLDTILPSIEKIHTARLRQKECEAKLALLESRREAAPFDLRRFSTPLSLCSLFGMAAATAIAYFFAPLPIAIGSAAAACLVVLGIGLSKDKRDEKKEELEHYLLNAKREVVQLQNEVAAFLENVQIEKLPDYSLVGNFLQQLKSAQEHSLTEKKKEALLLPLLEKREALARRIETLLGCKFSLLPEMEHALLALRKRLQEKEERERIVREMAHIQEKLSELLSRCSCQQEAELLERHALLASFAEAVEKKAKLEGNIAELKRQLESAPELIGEERTALEQKRKDLEEQEAGYRSFITEKAGIEKDIENAKKGRDLEEKRQARQIAADNLEAKKVEFRTKVLGHFLLEEIEESFKKETRPDALKNADAYFRRFTHSAYAIDSIGDEAGKPCFLAYDCKQSSVKKVHELSRGTRLQLLLAIRLGFIAAIEKKSKLLPIVLDEAAAHADDERWHAIADVLIQEAKEGRQILYFTCQQFAKEAWGQIAEEVSFHDLAKAQERIPYFPPVPQSRVVAPSEDEPLSAYCQRIDHPGLNFSLPVSAQAIGHFVGTSRDLHTLLKAGIATYGQVQKMHENKSLYPFLAHPSTTIAKGTLLEKFLDAYRIGRPPSVERGDLEEALQKGIVSETFFTAICDLAQEKKGRGDQILEALQEKKIKGFRANKIEELRASFLERGKLDTRPSLGPEELRLAFWQAYAPHADALSKEDAVVLLDILLHAAL